LKKSDILKLEFQIPDFRFIIKLIFGKIKHYFLKERGLINACKKRLNMGSPLKKEIMIE
jgi:hypothetical protein